jgi:ABC-type transport system involved in multi-copper enzyme maturation permease subunit
MPVSFVTLLVGSLLLLVQVLAALPWAAVLVLNPKELDALLRRPFNRENLIRLGVVLAVVVVAPVVFFYFMQDPAALEITGQVYGAVLQAQLTLDLFVLVFAVLLAAWPKGGAVALAAFREAVRQAMFWLLMGIAAAMITVSPFIPYFTFGEDYIMVKEIGYDTIMLTAVLFGTLAASLFISEEIEGRTAITLMSKPVSRRQFLLGKFVGILLAALVMFGLLGWYFEGVLLYKHWLDKLDPVPVPEWLTGTLAKWALPGAATDLLRGVGLWTNHMLETLPGLVLSFCQVMVLVAIAVSLATRLPMVVNLTTVLVVYFLAHLTPVLVAIGQKAKGDQPGSPVANMLNFMAQLFDTILPGLEFFRVGPALVSDTPLPAGEFTRYIGSVTAYGLLYTSIVLLFGLILFEDRDLA